MTSKRNLYIVGASSFGRELESLFDQVDPVTRDWQLRGFLHSVSGDSPLDGYPSDYQIVGDWMNHDYKSSDLVAIGVTDPQWKRRIYKHVRMRANLFNYISPLAVIGKFVTIGEGTIICPNCVITTNVRIGACVTLNNAVAIGHDVSVGDFSSIMGGAAIAGKAEIGSDCFLGSRSVVIPSVVVESGATVGAGSVVLRKVAANSTVLGNPAKRINLPT